MGLLFNKKKKDEDVEVENTEISKMYDSVVKKDKWFRRQGKKGKARIGSAIVYEIVGNQEVLDGVYPLLKGGVKDIGGDYTVINYKNKMKYLSTPNPQDFTPCHNTKIRKVLHVVKMAEDDFRIKKRFSEEYFREVKLMLTKQVSVFAKDEDGKFIKDDKGENVLSGYVEEPDIDEKTKQQKFEIIKEHYHMPSAIVQEGREAIKEGNEYEKKMLEWGKKNESWLKTNVFAVMSYAIIFLLIMSFTFLGNKQMDEWHNIRNDIFEDNEKTRNYISGGLVDKVSSQVLEKKIEAETPPI